MTAVAPNVRLIGRNDYETFNEPPRSGDLTSMDPERNPEMKLNWSWPWAKPSLSVAALSVVVLFIFVLMMLSLNADSEPYNETAVPSLAPTLPRVLAAAPPPATPKVDSSSSTAVAPAAPTVAFVTLTGSPISWPLAARIWAQKGLFGEAPAAGLARHGQ